MYGLDVLQFITQELQKKKKSNLKLIDDSTIKYNFFYSDNFGKTMTMTAISKGFRRIIKLLSESNKLHENSLNNVNLKALWTNRFETAEIGLQNDESLGIQIKLFIQLKIHTSVSFYLSTYLSIYKILFYRLSYGTTFEAIIVGKILAGV